MDDIVSENFLKCVIDQGAYSTLRNLRQYLKYMLDGVPLRDKRMLDVGGGCGLLTLWGAIHGANALCLEPDADGATSGMAIQFEKLKSSLGVDISCHFSTDTLQEFLQTTEYRGCYDVIMMSDSINHLDEKSCIELLNDSGARNKYLGLLSQVFESMSPGGYIVVTDCSRSNFFNDLGWRSPIMNTIEWEKHQSPFFWDKLFQQVGFHPARIKWSSPKVLGSLGRAILGYRLTAYFTFSHFRLLIRKPL